jgi:hypothetical protein
MIDKETKELLTRLFRDWEVRLRPGAALSRLGKDSKLE